MSGPMYEVLLEKKGRGRSFIGRPWSVRTFKLKGQNLEYFDGDKMKGTISIAGSRTEKIKPDEADGKTFPFAVNTTEEKLILNASCEEIRIKCIEIFNIAAKDVNWSLTPPPAPVVKTAEEQKIEKTQEEFDQAATAAVASAFAQNAEKARLEEEQRALEEERKRQVEAAAAKVLEEEMANKKLREAREAEERQREEQERQIMNLLKGLGAKAKFKTAIAHGKMAVAREAAACMVQGNYRAKLARRRMLQKKAEKERLLREGYAKKIQCRYRARLARKRMEGIKAEKLRIKQKLAAMKVQCSWRIYIAKKKYRAKQNAKLQAEYQKSRSKQRGIIMIETLIRGFLAKRKVARIRLTYPGVAFATVLKTEGLSVADSAHADPAVYVSAVVLNLALEHPARTRPTYKIADDLLRSSGKAVSNFRVDTVSSKKLAMATSLTSIDYLAITLIDTRINKDESAGQAFIRVSEVRQQLLAKTNKYYGTIEVTVPVAPNLVQIVGENKENLATCRKAVAGTVTVAVTLPDPNYTTCGWLWKVSESLLSNAWKKRWFVLVDGQLQYYNSELHLDQSKNVVLSTAVTGMKEELHKGRNGTRISYTSNGTETFWMLDWDEAAPSSIKRSWQRKIYRNCPQLTDLEMEKVRARFAAIKTNSNTTISPNVKGKVPVSKRMSIFK